MADESQQRRLLVVDDSPTVLRVIEGVLTQASYDVTCTDSGAEVLALAHKIKPHMILVDFAMPGVSGYGVCYALGSDEDLAQIPIVLMITRGDAVGTKFVHELGIIDHITKPFAPEVLLAVVEHSLKKANNPKRQVPLPAMPRTVTPTIDLSPTHARRALAALLVEEAHASMEIINALEVALSQPHVIDSLRRLVDLTNDRHSLRGELAVVPIAEVLQILSLQRQSGFLHVQSSEVEITIALERGLVRLVTGTNLAEEFLLGSVMVQEELIAPNDLGLLLNNRKGTTQRLGNQVVKLGFLTRDDLHRALRRQSSQIVYELLRWPKGIFWFEPRNELPADVLEFEFDLTIDELLMEGFRRVDEWRLIESVIPSFDGVPCRTPTSFNLSADQLTDKEQAVIAAVDGSRTVREIVQQVGTSSFDAARIIYGLVSSRLLAMQLQISPTNLENKGTIG
ncbi:MAG: hypothetical protein A2289_04550 [Deltaproteobacteria bacterium RIFOXYA12_FULL_58_15]|nr:MAG: hypothetical protein A2289_04550 [Deltaproteobacteria bacterium RIFOXYA12_FULL_58_15]